MSLEGEFGESTGEPRAVGLSRSLGRHDMNTEDDIAAVNRTHWD